RRSDCDGTVPTTMMRSSPTSTCLAMVPPIPISMSSGWAPKTSTLIAASSLRLLVRPSVSLQHDLVVMAQNGDLAERRDLDLPASGELQEQPGDVHAREGREDRGTAHPRVDFLEAHRPRGIPLHLHARGALQAEEG